MVSPMAKKKSKAAKPSKYLQRMMAKREREATMTREAVASSESAAPVEPREPKKERPNATPAEELIRDGKRLEVETAVYDPAPPLAKRFPPVAKTEKVLYLCVAENSVCVKAIEYGRRFGPGQIVDLDGEILSDGSKLRDHVRLACWRPIRAGGA